jgi:hypothetical protein
LALPKQLLIVQAMSILFKKYHKRTPFRTFEGWSELFQVLAVDRYNTADLSRERAALLAAVAELVLLALWASQANVMSFLSFQGLGVFGTLLRATSALPLSLTAPILVDALRVLAKLLVEPRTLDELAQNPAFLADLLCCLNVKSTMAITSLVLSCLNTIIEDSRLQERYVGLESCNACTTID